MADVPQVDSLKEFLIVLLASIVASFAVYLWDQTVQPYLVKAGVPA